MLPSVVIVLSLQYQGVSYKVNVLKLSLEYKHFKEVELDPIKTLVPS